jgi:hypothetical protein
MGPHGSPLLSRHSKHEVSGEALTIALHCLIESSGSNTIKSSEIGVEQYSLAAHCVHQARNGLRLWHRHGPPWTNNG